MSTLTLQKLNETIAEFRKQNRRLCVEAELLMSVRHLSIETLEKLAEMAQRGLFDGIERMITPQQGKCEE